MASRDVVVNEEAILAGENREISILVACEEVTVTKACYSAGERVAGPHVHHEHTDAFYILEGALTFEIGREAESTTVSAGGFVAVPPLVAHSFRNDSGRPARWLTIHAHDGGFAAFMRGIRDGVEVAWDVAAVPAAGGLSASEAIVSSDPGGPLSEPGHSDCWVRCALPDLRVVEWHLREPHALTFRGQDDCVEVLLVIEGEPQVILPELRHSHGPGTLISVPRPGSCTLQHRRSGGLRILSLQTRRTRAASAGLPTASAA
jgi:mannose-6-phosphate isomerase-like protein (cupin superfamily)